MIALENGLPHTYLGFIGACTTIGIVIGAIIAWYATKSERKKIAAAHEQTNKAHEKTIEAKDIFIATLTRLHETAVAEMTGERDSYRKKAHDLAGELTAVGLRLKEYEMRPDLTTLYHSQQEWHTQREKFYEKMFLTQSKMQENLQEQGQILGKLLLITQGIVENLERTHVLKRAVDKPLPA
jgi:hypothetical protein